MSLEFEKPNASLLRELNAVARRAKTLEGVLARANYLPANFPTGELRFWIEKLQVLPAGTAEGCREPLNFAQERLSAAIRDHIGIDDDEGSGTSADEDAPPSLARDEPIGQAISDLIGTIEVASSEYERQADESARDDERDRPMRPTAEQATELQELDAKGEAIEAEAATFRHCCNHSELSLFVQSRSVTWHRLERGLSGCRPHPSET